MIDGIILHNQRFNIQHIIKVFPQTKNSNNKLKLKMVKKIQVNLL